jgi:HEPN domain-containing protein
MSPRRKAWLDQAHNDLAMAELGAVPPRTHVLPALVAELAGLGLDTAGLEHLRLTVLSRMATSSRYPEDDTPPQQLFDAVDAEEAITTARAVLAFADLDPTGPPPL